MFNKFLSLITILLLQCFVMALSNLHAATDECYITVQQAVTICNGDSIVIGSNVYNSSGQYNDTLPGGLDCDTLLFTDLTVLPPITTQLNPVICQGETLTVGDSVYAQTGIYTQTLSSLNGCDSLININLTVIAPVFFTNNASICSGGSVQVGNNVYTLQGVYIDTLNSSRNCDSIVTTNLIVLPKFTIQQAKTICQGDSVVVGRSVYKQAGLYTDSLKTIANCDSVVFTNVIVNPVSFRQQSFNICQGDSVVVGNKVYKQNGTFTDTLKNRFNCDSILITTVSILSNQSIPVSRTICEGERILVGNNVYNTSGVYTDTLLSSNGCDSIVQLTLTVIPIKRTTLNPAICSGQGFQVGNKVYTLSGTYVDTLNSFQNCDSIVTTNLTVRPIFSFQQSKTICQGDSVIVGQKVYKQTGQYSDTLKTIFNCDSIIFTSLLVNPTFNRTQNVSICNGQTYAIGNNVYSVSGTYRDTLRTIRNCDSIVVTVLSVRNQINVQQSVSICEGQTYQVGNSVYDKTGVYNDTFPGSGGCDSIVTTQLTVSNSVSIATELSICSGEIYQFGDTILLTPGVYVQTISGSSGCDSLVTLTLKVNPVKETTINRTACQGDSIVIRGNIYTQSGTVKFTEKTYLGCDSIISYVLVFNRRDQIQRNLSICVPGTFENVSINRDTVIVRNFKNIFNCDSIVTNTIKATFPDDVTAQTDICFGTSYEGFIVRNDTVIQKQLKNIDGCDSLVTESITVLPLPVITVTRDTTINPGSPLTLFASGAVTYQWNTGQQGAAINVAPTQSTVYTVTGFGANGCRLSVNIQVNVNACRVEVPTLFTPNGDGIHDELVIKGGDCLKEFSLTILNRWGNVIYETDDPSERWDGTFNGTLVSEGVYYFVISGLAINSNAPVQEKGYVHIKR